MLPRAVHFSLRLPCLWEQPKSATGIELITTALVQCAYPRTTWSSAAHESSKPSESWVRLGTKDGALKICSSFSELKNWHKTYFLINKATHGVTVIITVLKIENLVSRNWRNVKTHHLISGIKSEILIDMFLIIPNLSHALAATLDLFSLGVIVYDWTSFLATKTLGIDTEIVFLCC